MSRRSRGPKTKKKNKKDEGLIRLLKARGAKNPSALANKIKKNRKK